MAAQRMIVDGAIGPGTLATCQLAICSNPEPASERPACKTTEGNFGAPS